MSSRMPFIDWAIHMIQWLLQKVTSAYPLVNLKNNLSSNVA